MFRRYVGRRREGEIGVRRGVWCLGGVCVIGVDCKLWIFC